MRAFVVAAIISVVAADLANFVPYGSSVGDSVVARCDDCYQGPYPFQFKFYGDQRSNAYINNNGQINFDRASGEYTPYGMAGVYLPTIAGYWYDVDTRPYNGGNVYFRTTTDPAHLAFASARVSSTFHATRMFVVTWESVGVYSYITSQLQTFQIACITDDNDNSWVLFAYGQLQRGSAGMGVAKGDGVTYLDFPGSMAYDSNNYAVDRVVPVNTGTIVLPPPPPAQTCGNGVVEGTEECDGGDCCSSTCSFATSDTVCRAAAGTCDLAETCSGSASTCPADDVAARGTVCRPAVDSCDITETCDGSDVTCPADALSQTTSCFCGRQNLGDGEMGYYCNANGGFYQCLGGVFASQSRSQSCAAGTHCGCSFGTECSCDLAKSPCVFASDVQTC